MVGDDDTMTSLLPDDWMEGVPLDHDHVEHVAIARQYLPDFQHGDAVRLWEAFFDVAEQWKWKHGVKPPSRGLFKSFPLSALKPWGCAGPEVKDPVGLITRELIEFDPYHRLEREHGRAAILAVTCLAHAAGAPDTLSRNRIAYRVTIELEKLRSIEPDKKTAAIKDLAERVDAIGPTYKHGTKFPPGSRPGRMDSLTRSMHAYARCHPGADADTFWRTHGGKPNARDTDTIMFDGKSRTRKTIRNRWSSVIRKRREATKSAEGDWIRGHR